MSIICPYCLSELHERAAACPHCGGMFAGRNPAGSLPVGTVLGGRYTVGEIERIDGEGILYRGAENVGRLILASSPSNSRDESSAVASSRTRSR